MSSPGREILGRPKDERTLQSWRKRQPLHAWWVLAVGVMASLVLLIGDRVKLAVLVMGIAFLAAAVLRLVLPRSASGGLVVRSRAVDVVLLTLAGVGLVGMAWLIKIPQGW